VNRVIQLPAQLALIAVPVVGWFVEDWGATTLVVYWFETVAACTEFGVPAVGAGHTVSSYPLSPQTRCGRAYSRPGR
jgi:hypothetical protein